MDDKYVSVPTSTSGLPRWRQLAEGVAAQIHSAERAPGSKLPSVAEQEQAGFSQTTTMRAYRELITQGLAISIHGSGTYVADPLPTAPTESLDVNERLRTIEERLDRLEQAAKDQ